MSGTSDLQARPWSIAKDYAFTHRDPVTALYVSALNTSIDTTEERVAVFENRIPLEARILILSIGFAATIVIGVDVGSHSHFLRILLPLVIAGALALTLDAANPRYGFIRLKQPSMDRLERQILGPGTNR